MNNDNLNSEWNYGNSYLYVIREIENKCLECASIGDLKTWFVWLKALYRELSRRMTTEERKQAKELIYNAQKELMKSSENARDDYFRQVTLRGETQLEDLEMYLKEIIKKRKMDLPTSDDPSKALL